LTVPIGRLVWLVVGETRSQFDQRGHGLTDNPGVGDAYALAALTADTAAFIRHCRWRATRQLTRHITRFSEARSGPRRAAST